MNTRKPCRCVLRDMPEQKAYYESVIRYRASLSEKEKALDALYEQRLNICRQCRELNNGTCMQCGCCVDIRAARADQRCPMGRWQEGSSAPVGTQSTVSPDP